MKRQPYTIAFADEADEHMKDIAAGERTMVTAAIEQRLAHQPTVATRNRKRLRPNPVAPFVLRVSHLRVYYEVKGDPERVVTVRAIGIKRGDKLFIGGVEVDLS